DQLPGALVDDRRDGEPEPADAVGDLLDLMVAGVLDRGDQVVERDAGDPQCGHQLLLRGPRPRAGPGRGGWCAASSVVERPETSLLNPSSGWVAFAARPISTSSATARARDQSGNTAWARSASSSEIRTCGTVTRLGSGRGRRSRRSLLA